jgi:hypothetical protein
MSGCLDLETKVYIGASLMRLIREGMPGSEQHMMEHIFSILEIPKGSASTDL